MNPFLKNFSKINQMQSFLKYPLGIPEGDAS